MSHQILKDKNIVIKDPKNFKLKSLDSNYKSIYKDEKTIKKHLENYKEKISKLQHVLFAQNKHSILIVLQAIDAAGKDSCIKHVMSGVNPQGCSVTSFKQPSAEELNHDFLWRTYKALPEKGKIGIFNRSYYEEVLVTKVHPEFIVNQNIPSIQTTKDIDEKFWEDRYRAINEMERHLVKNGTIILKVFLNLSKKEQKNRFIERIDTPEKNYKFSYGDIKERKLWNEYQKAFETMIQHTSTKYAPWHVLPADTQWVSRAMFGDLLLETLENLNLSMKPANKEDKELMAKAKTELLAE